MGDGLLYRQRGRGTFVRQDRIEQELATLTGFYEEMRMRGSSPAPGWFLLRCGGRLHCCGKARYR